MVWKELAAFGVFNVLYAAYLELNPKIGGVILRPDGEGNKKINLSSYWNFIKAPFNSDNIETAKQLWKPQFWDINYPVCAVAFMTGFGFISHLVPHLNEIKDDSDDTECDDESANFEDAWSTD